MHLAGAVEGVEVLADRPVGHPQGRLAGGGPHGSLGGRHQVAVIEPVEGRCDDLLPNRNALVILVVAFLIARFADAVSGSLMASINIRGTICHRSNAARSMSLWLCAQQGSPSLRATTSPRDCCRWGRARRARHGR